MIERNDDSIFLNFLNYINAVGVFKCLFSILEMIDTNISILCIYGILSHFLKPSHELRSSYTARKYHWIIIFIARLYRLLRKGKHMVREDETRSVESTEENQGETAPSRGRRGFMKKAAVASILGMSGAAVGTDVVSATETTEAAHLTEPTGSVNVTKPTKSVRVTEDMEPVRIGSTTDSDSDVQTSDVGVAAYGYIEIEGVADYSNYTVDSYGSLSEWYGVEPGDDLNTVAYGDAYGEVQDRYPGSGADEDGFYDAYIYENGVDVTVTSGIVDIYY
jgi:hypothetical protein